MQLQLIYDEVVELKLKQKKAICDFKDALVASEKYQTLLRDIQELRNKKVAIETQEAQVVGLDLEKLDKLKKEAKEKMQMITDQAMTDLMEGKTVLVKDQYDNEYEPVWSVRFKRK